MRTSFFWIPAAGNEPAERELNQFLASHRVIDMEKHFATPAQVGAGRAGCVVWAPGEGRDESKPGKIDHRDVLDPETFRIFAALREWRKEDAAAAGVPIYSVANNEQLAPIARERIDSAAGLERIDDLGQGRKARYVDSLLAVCRREMPPRDDGAPSP